MVCALALWQTAVAVDDAVMVGNAFIVTVKLVPVLTHPFAFFTVSVPVYVPAAVFAGTAMLIGLVVNVASVTAAKLLAGVPLQLML